MLMWTTFGFKKKLLYAHSQRNNQLFEGNFWKLSSGKARDKTTFSGEDLWYRDKNSNEVILIP